MLWGGREQRRGHYAHSLSAQAGATALAALLMGEIASFILPCWEKDRQIAARLVQANGRHPHPRSVARVRRLLVHEGFIESKRIYAGQRPHGADFITTGGTTSKSVRWMRLGAKDPASRADKRRARKRELRLEKNRLTEQRRMLQDEHERQQEAIVGPRHSAAIVPLDAELAQVLVAATVAQRAHWSEYEVAESDKLIEGILRAAPPTKPPD